MHILHGDFAAGLFKTAFQLKNSDLLVFRDVLSCGPLDTFRDIESWQRLRSSFWKDVCADNCESVQAIESLPRDFYRNFSILKSEPACKLWVGTGLSDQLLLAFIIYLFDSHKLDFGKLSIIQFDKIKRKQGGYYPVQGLGILEPDQIKEHPLPFKIHDRQIQYGKLAWEAFSAATPKLYAEFMASKKDILPLLHHVMSYVYYRYPKAENGLTCWDEALLKNTLAHGPKATKVIGYTLADGFDGLDLVGDWYLFSRLKKLANPKLNQPLLKMNFPDRPMRETEVKITDFGMLALDGQVNVISENGIDDWVGGVHLDSEKKNVWVRENKQLRRFEII